MKIPVFNPKLTAVVAGFPGRNFSWTQINPDTARFLAAKGISFSATIKKKDGQFPVGAAVENFRAFRQFFGQWEPALVKREISHYDLENDPSASPFTMADNRSQLHLRVFHTGDGRTVVVNCVNSDVIKIAEDPGSSFFQFLRQHQNLDSVSLHIGAASEDVIFAGVDEHWAPVKDVFPEREVMSRMSRTLRGLETNARKAGFKGRLLIESLDYHYHPGGSAYEYVAQPDFIRDVYRQFRGYDLLLDPGHLLVSAVNLPDYGQDKIPDYFTNLMGNLSLMTGRLTEIHLAVPQDHPETNPRNMFDNHRAFFETLYGGVAGAFQPKEEVQIILNVFGDLLTRRDRVINPPPILINFETPLGDLFEDVKIVTGFIERLRASGLLSEPKVEVGDRHSGGQ